MNSELILRSIQRGVAKAILQHKEDGYPIVVWRNNKVTEILAEDIKKEECIVIAQ